MNYLNATFPVLVTLFFLWLSRNLIKEFLTNAIKHDYKIKFEELKSEMKEKETEIALLRNGVLEGITSKQSKLYKYQINAVKNLWNEVSLLGKAKNISIMLSSLPFNKLYPLTEKDERIRTIFKSMGSGFDINTYDFNVAKKNRPFISPLAWAYFNAYQSIILNDVTKLKILEIGAGGEVFNKENNLLSNLVKSALPEHSENIDKNINQSFTYLLDELEDKLLCELNNIIEGKTNDQEALNRAALILKESKLVMKNNLADNNDFADISKVI